MVDKWEVSLEAAGTGVEGPPEKLPGGHVEDASCSGCRGTKMEDSWVLSSVCVVVCHVL